MFRLGFRLGGVGPLGWRLEWRPLPPVSTLGLYPLPLLLCGFVQRGYAGKMSERGETRGEEGRRRKLVI